MSDEVVRRRKPVTATEVADAVTQATKEIVEEDRVDVEPDVKDWIGTTCTVLDLAITGRIPGGFPVGRICHIFGGESACKTVIGTAVLGSAQRRGCITYFEDVERTFVPNWASMFGLNVKDKDIWHLDQDCETLEDLFDNKLRGKKGILQAYEGRNKVVLVDSLSALTAIAEQESKLSDATFGTVRAKQMSTAMRTSIAPLAKSNTTLIFIDQARDKVGGFSPPGAPKKETWSGGRAVGFYSSVRVHLKTAEPVKNSKKKEIGTWINFSIDKNKVGVPHRKGSFCILYDYGIDNVTTNLVFLQEFQESEKTVVFNDVEDTVKKMVEYVESNHLEKQLELEVEKAWKESYATGHNRQREVW